MRVLFFLLFVSIYVSDATFRFMPEHVFDLDVSLICQPRDLRLKLNAVISIWEADKISRDDFIGKVNVEQDRSFQFTYRHEEFGRIKPYMLVFHDCDPRVIKDKCYARTEYHFAEPEQLGSTLYLSIDLLKEHTDIICDRGYLFSRPPPQLSDSTRLDEFTTSPRLLNQSNGHDEDPNEILSKRER